MTIEAVFLTTKHIFCRWHISQNVLTKSSQNRVTVPSVVSRWGDIMEAETEEAFERRYARLMTDLMATGTTGDSRFATYLQDNWLPLREFFATYALNNHQQVWSMALSILESLRLSLHRLSTCLETS